MSLPKDTARHTEKMKKRKAAQDKKTSQKTIERGLLIVHTGSGKGKSTAAFGMAIRAIAHGMNIGIIQFIKGAWESGERDIFEKFPENVEIHAAGEGFTWETQNRERDMELVAKAWERAREMILDPKIKMVILDELNIALRYEYLPLDEVVEFLQQRPADTHVIVTGRNAKSALVEAADLVTEMALIKHPFRSGVKAQKGIEF
ncbi:MAG TPA: cob(I)yrinic acid a,c-diamide adenosyltransferase [Rhizobiales bacterium]|nr:cob(I)yrinic acid a,c-diamide adenosyltransferase [Hyphomicrobiales bacterium]